MRLKLDDEYVITADSSCYTLQRSTIGKEGKNKDKEVNYPVGYFGTLESGLKAYKELRVKQSDATTIQEVLEIVKGIDRKIENILGGI